MENSKSILVTNFGGYDCLQVTDYPLKKPQENEIEVQVYYCGVNFADLYTRQGLIPHQKLPFVLGIECSGIITAVGPSTEHAFKVGQRVVCYDYMGGMFRQKIVISSKKCYAIPENIGLKEAAAVTVNYLTAYLSLMHCGNLRPKQNVLINSCAGGVGWAATQLATLVDDVVLYGTTSSLKTKQVKANGINYVLSYENLAEQIEMLCPDGLDLIIDNEAGSNFAMKKKMLKPFGRIVFIGSNDLIRDEKRIFLESLESVEKNIPLSSLIMNTISASGLHLGILAEKESVLFEKTLRKIFDLLLQKKISPQIDSVWSFDDIIEASKRLQQRKNVGKVLLSTGLE